MVRCLLLLLSLASLAGCSSNNQSASFDKKDGLSAQKTAQKQATANAQNKAQTHSADGVSERRESGTGSTSAVVADAAGVNGWLMFRGNRRRTGSANVAGPRKAQLKWVFRTQGRIYADAAISKDGQTIYAASHDNHLYAVDLDGRKKWSFDAGGKIWTSPAISAEGYIYVGSDEDALFALDSKGSVRWKFITTEPPKNGDPKPEAGRFDVDTSPLLMDDGTVVFGCHVKLIALRPAAGDLRWAFTAGSGRAKIFSSAAQSLDGTLFFGTQGNYFFALNQTSDVRWTVKTEGDNDSTPVVDLAGNVFFASDDGKVRSIAPGNKLRWMTDAGAAIRAPLGLSNDGTLYAATYGNAPFVMALDKDTGREKWRFSIEPGLGDFYGIQSGITTDREGYVYFGGRDGYVYCLNPQGQLVWKHQTDDQVDAGPVLGADGTLYVGSDDGRLYAFAR